MTAPSAIGTGRPSSATPKTQQEILELGEYCETLMRQDFFNQLCAEFEDQTVRHMLQTLPHETEKREDIYASMRGHQDFLGLLMSYVEAANNIKTSDDDQDIDSDPSTIEGQIDYR